MEWVYDSPLSKDERDAYIGLKKELKKDYVAKNTVKVLSLLAFLRKHRFRSAEEIQNSVFLDAEKTKPIFDAKTAKKVFQSLRHKGGNSRGNFPFTDRVIKDLLGTVTPDFIENPVVNLHSTFLKNPTENIKNWVPVLKLASNVVHSGTSIAANNVAAVGEGIGGPIGATIAAPIIALMSAPSGLLATAEGDLGQLAATMLAVVPVAGDPAANALKQTESMLKTAVDSGSDLPLMIPYVGSYIQEKRNEKLQDAQRLVSQPQGGKRFSTQKHKYNKWRKTRRNKSAKV
jgi:hypothetical protein